MQPAEDCGEAKLYVTRVRSALLWPFSNKSSEGNKEEEVGRQSAVCRCRDRSVMPRRVEIGYRGEVWGSVPEMGIVVARSEEVSLDT